MIVLIGSAEEEVGSESTAEKTRLVDDFLPIPKVVQDLRRLLGASLLLHITGVSAAKVVRSWAEGAHAPSPPSEERLRLAHSLAAMIADQGRIASTASWFTTANTHLQGRSPAMVLREEPASEAGPLLLHAVRRAKRASRL